MPAEIGPSAAAIFLVSAAISADESWPSYPIVYNTFACTIDAMWIPSESWIDLTTDDIVHETISNPLQERHHFKEGHGKIQLSRSWLDTLNVLTDLPNTSENATTFQILADGCKNNASNHTLLEICIQSVVALFVTDGLARMQSTTSQLWLWHGLAEEYFLGATESSYVKYSTPAEVVTVTQDFFHKTPDSIPRFSIDILQYGYGLRGSKGILIATVILLTYVLVAFIHMVVVVIEGWSSNTWGTTGELIALSANSSPTKLLQNTCEVALELRIQKLGLELFLYKKLLKHISKLSLMRRYEERKMRKSHVITRVSKCKRGNLILIGLNQE
jgi:hypothetical protein